MRRCKNEEVIDMKKHYKPLIVAVLRMDEADMIRTSGEISGDGSGGFTVKEQLFTADL